MDARQGLDGATLDGATVAVVAALVVLSLTMVAAMVRYSRAVLRRVEGGERLAAAFAGGPEADRAVLRPGAVYALAWLGLIAGFLHLFRVLEGGWTPRSLGILALVGGSYWVTHAVLLGFAAALIRANLRDAAAAGRRRGTAPTYVGGRNGAAGAAIHGRGPADEARDGAPALRPAAGGAGAAPAGTPWAGTAWVPTAWAGIARPGAARAFRERLVGLGRLLGMLAVAFAFVAVGAAVPALRELEGWFEAHRGSLVPPVAAVAGIGWALLMGGAIHGVLTARGGEFSDTASFREVKRAFRARSWRTSRRWRRLFVMAAGAALMTVGLFGLAIVLAPAGLKLLFAAALVYAAVQTVRGLRRV